MLFPLRSEHETRAFVTILCWLLTCNVVEATIENVQLNLCFPSKIQCLASEDLCIRLEDCAFEYPRHSLIYQQHLYQSKLHYYHCCRSPAPFLVDAQTKTHWPPSHRLWLLSLISFLSLLEKYWQRLHFRTLTSIERSCIHCSLPRRPDAILHCSSWKNQYLAMSPALRKLL
jgi:hypothetical protein